MSKRRSGLKVNQRAYNYYFAPPSTPICSPRTISITEIATIGLEGYYLNGNTTIQECETLVIGSILFIGNYTLRNRGTINIIQGGVIYNTDGISTGGIINNTGGGIINNQGTIHNNIGTINNTGGKIDNTDGTILNNGGTIDNTSGNIVNILGSIYNTEGGRINNTSGMIYNIGGGGINNTNGIINNTIGTIHLGNQNGSCGFGFITGSGNILGNPASNTCP